MDSDLRRCGYCNDLFVSHDDAIFCSMTCYKLSRKYIVVNTCDCCKNKFKSSIYDARKFCNNKCFFDFKRAIFKCNFCGVTFESSISDRKFNTLNFCSKTCKNKWFTGKPNYKLSEVISKKMSSEGYHPICKKYKCGYLLNESTNEMEYYSSSYEKVRMEQLNKSGVKWTKRHKICIPYKGIDGKMHNYIPDFLVNGSILEEVKPRNLKFHDNNLIKARAAMKYCKKNNLKYKILTEKELNI